MPFRCYCLPNNLNSEVRLFADDCVVYRQIQNDLDHTLLQDDLITLEKWQNDWQMSFNVKKCFIMRITHMSEIQKFSTKNSANAYWKKQVVTHTLASTSQTTYPGLHISVISLHPQIDLLASLNVTFTHVQNPLSKLLMGQIQNWSSLRRTELLFSTLLSFQSEA